MKKLPIGIQSFSELIEGGYLYIDKTAYIYDLISQGKYYFLARPRRFGKSLLLSTIKEIFQGNKKLFDGFAITEKNYSWEKYPVILFSFAGIPHSTPELLEQGIVRELGRIAQTYNITINKSLQVGQILQDIVLALAEKNKVVLLIDEYDYPIVQHAHESELAKQLREVVKNFYGVIKDLDQSLKFVILTGVSKFAKTSIFSGLNNLRDLTLSQQAGLILGYTEKEITSNFKDYIVQATDTLQTTERELTSNLEMWYNGYSFSRDTTERVYNPFSVLNFFADLDFKNYWFESGTPTFLINLIKAKSYPVIDFEKLYVAEIEMSILDIESISLKALLFQTGYLTIKKYDQDAEVYELSYPNKEVEKSLSSRVFESLTSTSIGSLYRTVSLLYQAFVQQDMKKVSNLLTGLFATIPYSIQIPLERYYQTVFYLIFKVLGANIIVEEQTNIGRIDAVLQTPDSVFIIEFKINASPADAIKQIEQKRYFEKYSDADKQIVLVGIAFDTNIRNVSGVEAQQL